MKKTENNNLLEQKPPKKLHSQEKTELVNVDMLLRVKTPEHPIIVVVPLLVGFTSKSSVMFPNNGENTSN